MDDNSDSLINTSQSQIDLTNDSLANVDDILQQEGAPYLASSLAFAHNSDAEADVLSDPDLLGLILSHFTEQSSPNLSSTGDKREAALAPNRSRRHLLQVGLTCKAFFDPAMNQLWYEMDSFLPLLRLIPKVVLDDGVYTTAVILEMDIQRLQLYGQWIRHIQISSFKEKVSGHIYSAIARYMFGKCLFPALKNLHIHSLVNILHENFQIFPLLASSPLSTIEIKKVTYKCRTHLGVFLHEMSRLHSAENNPVSTLHLGGNIGSSVLPYLEGFLGISKLTLVHQSSIFRIDNLRSLAKNLASLSVLELNFLSTDVDQAIYPLQNSVVNRFEYIQTLSLSAHAFQVLGILRYIYGECLSRVNLNIFGLGTGAPTDVLRACVERCTTMTPALLHLQLTFPNTMILPKDLFAPLRGHHRHIRSLEIKSHLVDRAFLQTLFQGAGEWSDLEVLKFEHHEAQPVASFPSPMADLRTLPLLCTSSPKLCTLDIYLCHPDTDAAGIEALLQSQMQTMEQTTHGLLNLKILFVDSSSVTPFTMRDITLAITTSRFISHFFPNVQQLDISHYQQSRNPAWKDWCRGVVEMTTALKAR